MPATALHYNASCPDRVRRAALFWTAIAFLAGNDAIGRCHWMHNRHTCATRKHTTNPITSGSSADSAVHRPLPVSL